MTDHTDHLVEMPDIAEVRTNVLVAVGEVAHPLVAVTSARDDISRRDVAVKLAGSIARTGRRVTLIDADMTDRGQATDESAAWTLITARAVSEADPAMLVSEAFHRSLVDTAAANDLVVVAFGDSLTSGWGLAAEQAFPSQLQAALRAAGHDVEVVNASVSGETTAGGRGRLDAALKRHEPDVVVLELGGNDGLRGLPPPQMRANLADMIETSQQAGAEVLLLGIRIPPNYGQAYADAFSRVYRTLAERYDVPLVPFILEGIALDDSLMQDDGIHPTAEAQPQLLDNIWPALEKLLPEQAVAEAG